MSRAGGESKSRREEERPMKIEVRIQSGDFDPGTELDRLRVDTPGVGGLALSAI